MKHSMPSCNTTGHHHELSGQPWIHDLLSESFELLSMQRIGHAVSSHLIGWTVFHVDVPFFLLISDKEAFDVEVSESLSSTLAAIFLQECGTFIVLVQDVLSHWMALSFQEWLGPQHGIHHSIGSHNFSFCGAPGVHPLLPADGCDCAFAHGHGDTHVTSEVRMHCKGGINMPF